MWRRSLINKVVKVGVFLIASCLYGQKYFFAKAYVSPDIFIRILADTSTLHAYSYCVRNADIIRADTTSSPPFPSGFECLEPESSGTYKKWIKFGVNYDNMPYTLQIGDTVISVINWEDYSGTIYSVGYYAVINDTYNGSPTIDMPSCSLRPIPAPIIDTIIGDSVKLVWRKAIVDSGRPFLNKLIEGYAVYRSEDGINFTLIKDTIKDTFCWDSVGARLKKYFYALKLIFFRGNKSWYLSRKTYLRARYDVKVSKIISPPDTLDESDTVKPMTLIENVGYDTVFNCSVYFFIDTNGFVIYGDTTKIDTLLPGCMDTAYFKEWTPKVGNKTFNCVSYAIISNNGYPYDDTLSKVVFSHFHNLIVKIELRDRAHFDIPDSLVRPYIEIPICAFVINTGTAQEQGCTVKVKVDTNGITVFRDSAVCYSTIMPGDTWESFFYGWITSHPEIEYRICEEVSYTLDKYKEDNFDTLFTRTFYPDLEMFSVVYPTNSDTLEPWDEIRFLIKIKNNSPITIYNFNIEYTVINFDTLTLQIDTFRIFRRIEPSKASVCTSSKKWSPNKLGGRVFKIDFRNLIGGDTVFSNDTISTKFYVYMHDLKMISTSFPDTIYPQMNYIPECIIANVGDKSEINVKVFCTINKETLEAVYYDTITLSSVQPSESILCQFSPWEAGPAAYYKIGFKVSHSNDLVWTNNQLIKIVENMVHDISIDSIYIPDSCKINSSYYPFAKISNRGRFAEYNINIKASILYGKDEVYRDSVLINELPVGSIFTHFFKEFVPNNRGDYILVTKVDYDDNWTLNNTLTKSFVAIEYGIEEPLNTYSVKIIGENPAINSMSLIYTLPEKSMVKIYLVDVCGRLVKMLENSEKDKGGYTIKLFNLPAGIYYCVFKLGDKKFIKKVIFIK